MNYADLVLKNGVIYSMKQNGERISGEAVAVKDGIIVMVGTNEDVDFVTGKNTTVIDCEGKSILPGLGDVHCHPSIAGSTKDGCNLFDIYREEDQDPREIIEIYKQILKEYIKNHPDKALIRGTGWVEANFTGTDVFPTRQDLDEICSDKPVILEAFTQHNLWVNTKAIEIASIDENTPDVQSGMIYREDNGYPSGVFNDPEAMDLIKTRVPGYDLSVEEYKDSILWYQKECANKYGVTMVMDCMCSDNARQAYKELADEGRLTIYLRGVYMLSPDHYEEELPIYIAEKGKYNSGKDFRIDTIKIFEEGLFYMVEPFEKEFCEVSGMPDDWKGEPYWNDEVLAEYCCKSLAAGFNVHIHAMGDGSVKASAEALAKAQKANGLQDYRNVIAHLMLVPDESSKLMGEAGIIGNVQMRWMVHDGDITGMYPMMGEARSESAYPMRKLLDDGVILAAGTDFPVTPPPSTMHEIQSALTREVFPECGGADYQRFKGIRLGTEAPVNMDEVMQVLSINSAYQIYAEEFTGSIEEGKSAELIVLDRNIEETPVEEIYSIQIEKTIFKGNVVFEI